ATPAGRRPVHGYHRGRVPAHRPSTGRVVTGRVAARTEHPGHLPLDREADRPVVPGRTRPGERLPGELSRLHRRSRVMRGGLQGRSGPLAPAAPAGRELAGGVPLEAGVRGRVRDRRGADLLGQLLQRHHRVRALRRPVRLERRAPRRLDRLGRDHGSAAARLVAKAERWQDLVAPTLVYIAVPMVLHGLYDTLLKKEMAAMALLVAVLSFGYLALRISRLHGADDAASTAAMLREYKWRRGLG